MSTSEAQNNRTGVEGVGFTPEVQFQAEPAEQPVSGVATPASRNKARWVMGAAYAICTVTFVGFLVAMLGAYVVKDDAVIVAGTVMVASAATAWTIGSVIISAFMVGPLFSAFRRIFQSRQLR